MRKSIKFGSIIILLILIFMVSDCSPQFKSKFNHDRYNPCGVEYPDPVECDRWRTMYPKEYLRYLERLENVRLDSIN